MGTLPAAAVTAWPHDHAGWQAAAAAGSVVLLLVTAAAAAAVAGRRWRAAGSAVAAAVAHRRPVWGVAVFALSLALSGTVAWHAGVPRPVVQDEFSYLLAADTFAHGRLANPTPPAADALQSPHELVRPTYASKYPPGQGLALAAGQAAAGLPIVGVWLTLAAAAAAVYWAAGAFVPTPWAVVAGGWAAVHPQAVDWSHVYWGGGVAELGGAVVVGAAGRLIFTAAGGSPRAVAAKARGLPPAAGTGTALLLGVGLAILANSRPYEGLAFALPVLLVLARRARRLAWPLAAVLVPTAAFVLVDNARVTGHPFTPPIVAYAGQFDVYPKFWMLPKRPVPAYPNGLMAAVHMDFEHGQYDALRTPAGLARVGLDRAWRLAAGGAGAWALLVPLAAAAWDRRARWVWAAVAATLLAVWAETFFLPHYAAPAAAAVIVLTTLGWRRLAARWPAVGVGLGVAAVAAAGVSAATVGTDPPRTGRDDVTAGLGGGRQLVFVRYTPGHASADEWVYNDADPPAERVVWAHAGGPAADRAVAAAYPNRSAWLLTVGAADLQVVPYRP